jgi:ABC-type uncharacterized transport system ATPase subunit
MNNILSFKDVYIKKICMIEDFILKEGDLLWVESEYESYHDIFISTLYELIKPKGEINFFSDNKVKMRKYITYIDTDWFSFSILKPEIFLSLYSHYKSCDVAKTISNFKRIMKGLGIYYSLSLDLKNMAPVTRSKIITAMILSIPSIILVFNNPFIGFSDKDVDFFYNEINEITKLGSSVIFLSDSAPKFYNEHIKIKSNL